MTDLRAVRTPRLVLVALLAVFAYAFVPLVLSPPASPLVGKSAPDFSIDATDGKPFVLADQRGKVVVVELFATWSDLCDEQQKYVHELIERRGDRVRVIGVVTSDDRKSLAAWLEKHPMKFPIAFDEGERVARAFDVNNLPAFVVVSPKGIVSSVTPAGLDTDVLTTLVDRAR